MIKITIECKDVEEAISTLNKLGAAPVVQPETSPSAPATAAPATPVAAPTTAAPTQELAPARKPRADAGKPRGPRKPVVIESEAKVVPEAAPEAPVAAAPSPSEIVKAEIAAQQATHGTTSNEAPKATANNADALAALNRLFNKRGMELTKEVLSRFGVGKLREMKPEDYAGFIVLAEHAVEHGTADLGPDAVS